MKRTQQQKTEAHKLVYESLRRAKTMGDYYPFIFPFPDQRSITPRRLAEQRKRNSHRWWDISYCIPRDYV